MAMMHTTCFSWGILLFSADRLAQDENEGAYPTELLNSMSPPGFAPHQLRLKVGIPIILLRNVKKGKTIND